MSRTSTVKFWTSVEGRGRKIVDENGWARRREVLADFTSDAHFLRAVGSPVVPEPYSYGEWVPLGGSRTVIVAGRHTVATLRDLDIRDKVVIYIPPAGTDTATRREVVLQLFGASRGVVVTGDEDSTQFARELDAGLRHPVSLEQGTSEGYLPEAGWPWAVAVRPEVLRGLFGMAGMDIAELRADSTPIARELPWSVALAPVPEVSEAPVTAPSVVAVLDGSDSVLKQEYIIVAAQLDVPSRSDSPADSVTQSQMGNDEAGLAGLLALAEALSQTTARPKRSILFLAASGGAPEFSGSRYAMTWLRYGGGRAVAALVLGRIGGSRLRDSLIVAGMGEVGGAPTPAWVAMSHPDLGLAVIDGGTAFRRQAMSLVFAQHHVPTFAFHAPGPAVSVVGSPAMRTDAEPAARALQLVFYVGQALASSEEPITWTEAGRAQFRQHLSRRRLSSAP